MTAFRFVFFNIGQVSCSFLSFCLAFLAVPFVFCYSFAIHSVVALSRIFLFFFLLSCVSSVALSLATAFFFFATAELATGRAKAVGSFWP